MANNQTALTAAPSLVRIVTTREESWPVERTSSGLRSITTANPKRTTRKTCIRPENLIRYAADTATSVRLVDRLTWIYTRCIKRCMTSSEDYRAALASAVKEYEALGEQR